MTRKGNPEDARLWIAEAEKRLEHAKDNRPWRHWLGGICTL